MQFFKKLTLSVLPVIIIAFSILIFFWPNFFGPAVNITPTVGTNDLTDANYPFRHFAIESFKKGKIPLWTNDISGGYPVLASGSLMLYPLNLLAMFLPLNLSVSLTVFSAYFLIGLFTYLFLLEIKLNRKSALFGAMSFMFSGFAVSHIIYWDMLTALAFFSGELFFLEKMVKTGKVLYSLILGLFFGFQILGGHIQITFYAMMLLGLYWLFLIVILRQGFLKSFFLFLLFVFLGLGIGALQILPQWEYTRNSDRTKGLSDESITRFNFPVEDLKTFLFPYASYDNSQTPEAFHHNGWPQDERYAYMGILGLFLALFGGLAKLKKNPRVVFFVIAAGLFLLLSFGTGSVFGSLLTKPPFNFFRLPLRFLFLVDFSLAVLAAFGAQVVLGWLGRLGKRKLTLVAVAGVLIGVNFVDLWYFGLKLHPAVPVNQWYQTPEVVKFLKENLKDEERVTTEYYYFASSKIFMTQRHLWDDYRTLINLRNLLPAFNNLLYDIPMAVGVANSGGMKNPRYNKLEMETFFNGAEYTSFDKASLSASFLFINRLLGVRYVLFSKELPGGLGLSRVFKTNFQNGQDNINVYEFFDYYPRTFMVGQAQKETPEKIKEHLLKVDFDPKQTIFLEEETSWGAQGAMAATAQFEKYEDQEVIIKTQSSVDGFLFLSDAYFPGWKAYVDGQEKKIYLANYAFRAVEVSQGEHEVVFRYEPEWFWWGIRISLGIMGVVVLGLLALGAREIWVKHKTI